MKKIFLKKVEMQKKINMLLLICMVLVNSLLLAQPVLATEGSTQKIKLILVDVESGEALAGGKFTLAEKINGSYENMEGKTGIEVPEAGYDLGQLPVGEYKLTENQAPGGYIIGIEAIEFRVTDEGVTMTSGTNGKIVTAGDGTWELVVVNAIFHVALPSTGGPGTLPYSMGGLLLIAAALISGFALSKKKLFSFLVTIGLVFTLSVPAMAETMTANVTGEARNVESNGGDLTYTYYVMMKLAENNGEIEYYVEDENFAKALLDVKINEKRFCTVTEVLGKNYWLVEINEEADFTEAEIGEALAGVKEYAVESGVIEGYEIEMDYGALILIESSIGTTTVMETSAAMEQLTMMSGENKHTDPTISLTSNTKNAEIGGTITYTIQAEQLSVSDLTGCTISGKLSDGLTMGDTYAFTYVNTKAASVTKELSWIQNTEGQSGVGSSDDVNGTVYTNAQNVTEYTITVPSEVLKDMYKSGEENSRSGFTITYAATMNQNVKVGEKETNTAKLNVEGFTSPVSEADVYTFGFVLSKVNEAQEPLEGVKFILTKENNGSSNYYTLSDQGAVVGFNSERYELSTDKNGKIAFDGLAAGQYTLTETETAEGYLLLEKPLVVTIGDNGKVSIGSGEVKGAEAVNDVQGGTTYYYGTITVTNSEWVTIADTGGSGTILWYVLGSILVMTAGMLFVFFRRNDRSFVS